MTVGSQSRRGRPRGFHRSMAWPDGPDIETGKLSRRQKLRQHLWLGLARRIIEVERDAGAALRFEEAADGGVAERPVADQHLDAAGTEMLGDFGRGEGAALIDLAGQAPVGGEI